ncbi:MAG: metal-dependent hydrolase, partial [Burkholderiales bacterium]
ACLLALVLREPRGWRALYVVCVLGVGTHIMGDLITSFGTMIFAPFSDARFGWGTTFIIDLWFSGAIVAGLIASAFWYRSRLPAVAACAVLVAYVGFQAVLRGRAIEFGVQHAQSRGLPAAGVTAHPRPVSPFNWTVFVSDASAHRYAHVNLVREQPRTFQPRDGFAAKLDAPYMPLATARWVTRSRYGESAEEQALARAAWESPALGFMRWFAERPAFDGLTEGSSCAWFLDLRFVNPGRDWVPFRFGACREQPGAPWRAYEREGESGRVALD